jgi:membrane-associated phospholipid phosphatase
MFSLVKKNSAFFIPYFIFLLAGGTILLLSNKTDIHLYINSYHCPAADFFFSNWTNLGLGLMIIPVALILAFIRFRYMIISVLGFALSGLTNELLKKLFHSPRPLAVFGDMHQSFYHVPNVEMFSDYSFPSGHTDTGFCMFCLLALYTKNKTLKFLYFIIAFLIAYSRMYLSEHFLKDVYGGAIVGVCSALLVYSWVMNAEMFNKFAERLDKPLIRLNVEREK